MSWPLNVRWTATTSYNKRLQEQQVSSIGQMFKKIVSMETTFENSNSFRNLTIKGVFLEKENGDINSKLRGEGKA